MLKDKIVGNTLLVVSMFIVLSNAANLTQSVTHPFLYGLLTLLSTVLVAVFLIKRDSTPQAGVVFLAAALVNTTVQLWGGALGPAAFLYPLLFLWMKRDSIGGPALTIAGVLGAVEFIAPVVLSTGLKSGFFDLGALPGVLTGAIIAGIIPLVSVSAVEYLIGGKSFADISPVKNDPKSDDRSPQFPDDVARSLIPILKAGTPAHGIFLFVSDRRDVWTLNEFSTDSGGVSVRYMLGPDDPVIQILKDSSGDIVHTRVERLSIDGSGALPWYVEGGVCPWITIVQFRRLGVLSGFMVLDYDSEEKRQRSSSILVDSVFLLSLSWELSREDIDNGFLAVCEAMEASTDIRGAVHKLIGRIVATYPDTTATVAIINKKDSLAIFESRGPQGDGRAGREFDLEEGVAGLAISRREPVRRLKMGEIRTFGEGDDPHRIVKSCCVVPLDNSGVLLGVLAVESVNEQRFSTDDLAVFKAYATVFSLAASRNQLQQSILKLKEVDRITGLPLLSSFHESLIDLIRGVRSRALTVTVLAVDIHHFTSINKEFGYTAGDTVLLKTAERMKGVLGDKAILARYGPDSFLVCLSGVDRVSAEAYAARIHEEFALNPIRIAGREISIRLSIGGAVSHVDRMIKRLPEIAVGVMEKSSSLPGYSVITDVGQFYGLE